MCSLEIENVSHISITLKTSDMADHKRRSGDSYGTFLLKSPGLSEAEKKVTYDDLLEEIGEFGRWQQWQIFLYSIPAFMSGALFMLGTFTSKLEV